MLRILFPIAVGAVVAGLSSGLAARPETYTANVVVRSKMPGTPAQRMVVVRDDGGPQDGTIQRRGFGFNVWAESAVVAEQLARMCMGILPTIADGNPIVRAGDLTGPFEIVDDETDLRIVDGVTLAHYYFTARVSVRGTDL